MDRKFIQMLKEGGASETYVNFLKEMDRICKPGKKYYFWETIHNLGDFILWLVLLPITPIIFIIREVKGRNE